jgi:hypothetical protein
MSNEVSIQSNVGTCVHHWMIEAPKGRESRGVCKNCGQIRNFANSNEHVMWEQTNTIRNSIRVSRPSEIRLSDEADVDD